MKQRAINESHNDPYQVNRNVWHSKTHTSLTMNPNKSRDHHRALEVAKDKIDKHRNAQTAAFQKGDHKEVEHHAKHLEMYKGVHDGILSGLAQAGHIHPKDAHRQSFKKLTEASNTFDKHQINIAKKTLKMSDVGASLMGGMSKSDAAKLISKHHGVEHTKKLLKQSGHNDDEIKKLTESLHLAKRAMKIHRSRTEKAQKSRENADKILKKHRPDTSYDMKIPKDSDSSEYKSDFWSHHNLRSDAAKHDRKAYQALEKAKKYQKSLKESEVPQKPALNAPHQAKVNVTFQRLNASHHKLKRATQEHSAARSPGDRAKALKNLEAAKREHIKAKNDHDTLKKLGESYSEFDLNLIFESFQILDERENSEYEKRAYKASLRSKPENLKKGADILKKNMKHHSVQANLHARKAHEIADKHQVNQYSEIKDKSDREKALHHASKADYHIKKQTSHFHAHQGLQRAAQARGILKSESESLDERKLLYLEDEKHPAFSQGAKIAQALNHEQKVKQLKNRVLRKHAEYSEMSKKHDGELKKLSMHKQTAEPRYAHHAHMADHYNQIAKKYKAFASGIDHHSSKDLKESKDYHVVDTHTGEIVSSHKAIQRNNITKAPPIANKKLNDLNTKHYYENPEKNQEGRYEILHKDEYARKMKLGLLSKK